MVDNIFGNDWGAHAPSRVVFGALAEHSLEIDTYEKIAG